MFLAIGLIGGLALFIYGMQLASEGLQLAAGSKLKIFLEILTKNRLVAVILGIIITVLIQSSSATTVILVGLVSASLMNLGQTVGVILGADIGTTLTVQLIAFKVSDYALLLIGIAVLIILFGSKKKHLKYIGQILLGFGLVFYGMKVMSEAVYPLRSNESFSKMLLDFGKTPLLGVLASAIFTGIIQSSAATIGLSLALANQNLISINMAVPLVLGANIGTCATALLSCIGASREAKRVAVLHIIIKTFGVLLLAPLLNPFNHVVTVSSSDITRQIANAHTFFNVILVVALLPCANYLARLVTWMVPSRKGPSLLGEATLLDKSLLEVPEVAVAQVHRQLLEMGRIVRTEMIDLFLPVVRLRSEELIARITRAELAVDSLYKSISSYVTSIGTSKLSDELMQRNVQLLYVANDLEHIGDVMMNVVKLTIKTKTDQLEFSEEGLMELEEIVKQAQENFVQSLKAFELSDSTLAAHVIKDNPRFLRLEKEMRYSHFDRMQCGNPKTIATSAVHLDLIESALRINSHSVSITQSVMGIV